MKLNLTGSARETGSKPEKANLGSVGDETLAWPILNDTKS